MGSGSNKPAATVSSYINLAALRWAETQTQVTSGIARTLLQFLARKSDGFGCCWFGQRTISEETGFCERGIRNHLLALKKAGLIRIVRRSNEGRRTTNVYHLIGWPDRKRIPSSGHPNFDHHVVEDATSLHRLLAQRQEMPVHAESRAAQNKVRESITTTEAEKRAILDRCLQSLGPWATEKNRRALTRSGETLTELLHEHDLHRHVLPVIEAMVAGGRRIPRLNSWSYFADAVARRAEKDAEEFGKVGVASHGAEAEQRPCPGPVDDEEGHADEAIASYVRALAARKRTGFGRQDS